MASGAAAIAYTIQALAQAGEHIVAQRTLYGGTYNLLSHTLPQYGIATTFVNVHDLDQVEQAIQENTKAIYLEHPGATSQTWMPSRPWPTDMGCRW